MNRSEQIMLTYFEDKESYTAFKLKYNVEVSKNINGMKNTELRVMDSSGQLRSYEGKPSCIDTGRVHDGGGTPLYSISWLDVTINEGGPPNSSRNSRPSSEGPSSIIANSRWSSSHGPMPILFISYSNNDKTVTVPDEQIAADREALRAAHKKATCIDFDKFLYSVG